MVKPIDLKGLPGPAQQVLGSGANPKLRSMAAQGIMPGILPATMLEVVLLLSKDDDDGVANQAEHTLRNLPTPLLRSVLQSDLHEAVIDELAHNYMDTADVIEPLLRMPQVASETLEFLASRGSEAITEVIAVNEERLLVRPRLIELLYLNDKTRMSTADRLVEMTVRAGIELKGIAAWKEIAASIEGELIPEPGEDLPEDSHYRDTATLAQQLTGHDPYAEDDEGNEFLKERLKPLFQRLADMSASQKIRRATLGSKEERMMLIREPNRMVACAAARSPLMQEPEAVLVARNRSVSEDVLRIIAMNPEFMRSYQIKRNLVENSKTPISISQRLIPHIRESDLKRLTRNKNVSGAIQMAAKRHLARRGR